MDFEGTWMCQVVINGRPATRGAHELPAVWGKLKAGEVRAQPASTRKQTQGSSKIGSREGLQGGRARPLAACGALLSSRAARNRTASPKWPWGCP